MLLLANNLIFSQSINTPPTKCFSEAQVNEIFKGLKQGEYLKTRLDKTEKTLDDAKNLITEQASVNNKYQNLITLKDETISNNQFICNQEKEIKDLNIKQLQAEIEIIKKQSKKVNKQNFWKGAKIGGVVGIVATLTAVVLISK